MGLIHHKTRDENHRRGYTLLHRAVWFSAALFVLAICGSLKAQTAGSQISDITGNYQFLYPYNTLAILQENQMLKGYIDVLQGKSESDALLSYPITIGERKGNHVEFRTRKIHEKYYRFSGTVQRGKGKGKGDPDYLELVGELQTIQNNSVTHHETVDRKQVVFKSKGNTEREP